MLVENFTEILYKTPVYKSRIIVYNIDKNREKVNLKKLKESHRNQRRTDINGSGNAAGFYGAIIHAKGDESENILF